MWADAALDTKPRATEPEKSLILDHHFTSPDNYPVCERGRAAPCRGYCELSIL